MTVLEVILIILFVAFFVGTVAKIPGTLARKRSGDDIERARLVFFFLGCLMLVCMIPMRLFELLSIPVASADLAVVGANFLGYALTYEWKRKTGSSTDAAPRTTVRAYQIYYRGKPYALIAKDGIQVLLAHKLLKRQHTVELIEDFQTQAQRQGVGVTLLRSKDGSKVMLMRVEGPAPKPQGVDRPPA
ncbi:MAG: hypothetical protein O2782_22450 [bacterium]|nr:hypothetical protein [bacterium]